MKARKVNIEVFYNNKNISAALSEYLLSVSYIDNMSNKADDLQLTLEDRQHLWQSAWFPEKGAKLNVKFITENWQGSSIKDIGSFEVDEIETAAPPSTVSIKAVSVPYENNLRGAEKSRSWEKAELKTISNDIASAAGLELFFDTEENPIINRIEQTEESDLQFMMRLCNSYGLAIKVQSQKLVIFDEAKYESEDAIFTLIPEHYEVLQPVIGMQYIPVLSSYRFRSKLRDIYSAAHLKYTDSKTNNTIEYTFKVPDKMETKTLELNEQVSSIAEAMRFTKKALRNKNCEEITGSFDTMGNFEFYAGMTINVLGYGKFDGKYIITSINHKVGSGYKMSCNIRRCLNGY